MSVLIKFTLFYINVVLQHLYFNNKTLSAQYSSSLNTSESLSDSSSLRIEFNYVFQLVFLYIHPEGIANFFSLSSSWKCCCFFL